MFHFVQMMPVFTNGKNKHFLCPFQNRPVVFCTVMAFGTEEASLHWPLELIATTLLNNYHFASKHVPNATN